MVSSATESITEVRLDAASTARVLGSVALLLVLASTAGQLTKYVGGHDSVWGLVDLLSLDAERSVPTIFSVLLLFMASSLLGVITRLKGQATDPDVRHWATLAGGFLLMAVDEGVSLHERLIAPMREWFGGVAHGLFYFAWVIPGIGLVLVLALVFLRFWLRLPPRMRFTFALAAVIYLGGAIGGELIGGRFAEFHGSQNLTYNLIATVEESLEIAGVIVFIAALLRFLAEDGREARVRFS